MARHVGRLDWFGAYGFIYHLDGRLAARVDRSGFDGKVSAGVLHKSIVAFSASRAPGHTHPLAHDVKLLSDETDPALLRACFESHNTDIWPLVATRYLSSLPEREALEVIRGKLAQIDDPLVLLYRIPPRVLLLPEARDVRERFPLEDRVALYESFLDLAPFREEVIACLSQKPSNSHNRLWRRLLADEHDLERLRQHFLSPIAGEWQAVASRYLAKLSPQEALAVIRTKLEVVHKASILLPYVPAAVLKLPEARDVRIGLPAGKRLKLLAGFENLDAYTDEIIQTLARASAESAAAFWKEAAPRLTPGSALYALAPAAPLGTAASEAIQPVVHPIDFETQHAEDESIGTATAEDNGHGAAKALTAAADPLNPPTLPAQPLG
ncbi:MAG: hypothetical protein RMN25_01160 [Anaerolineae bacterium]|nr:hypothetical protein [Thermoflexales bacterium]MDW8406364.1 hypothetical protein [Anaerolineae bacterium]